MIKHIVTLLLVLASFGSSHGQKAANLMKNYVPSPEAYAFMQYEAIPVSKYTGVPSVNIPIYTIETGDYSLPVSLSYHASGIKVTQEASWVGLGWSLSAGGMISRSICGNDDYHYYADKNTPVPVVKYLSDDPADIEIEGDIYDGSSTPQNVEPDIFQYSFNGYSGKFYFRRGAIKDNLKEKFFVSNPEQNLRIETIDDSDGFIITVPGNVKYVFEAREYVKKYSEVYTDAATARPELNSDRNPGFYEQGVPTSWYLSRVEYPTKDTIHFDYAIETNYYLSPLYLTEQEIEVKDSKCFFQNNSLYYNQFINAMPGVNGRLCVNMSYTDKHPRLQAIRWKNGCLKFLPAGEKRLDVRCHAYKGGNGAYPLGAIELYQKDASRPLRTFSFKYSYFRGKDLFGKEVLQPDYLRSRLKLVSLSIKGTGNRAQMYKMEYDEREPLPQKNCYSCDAWGYFNNSSPWLPYTTAVAPFDVYKYNYSPDGLVRAGLLIKKGTTFSSYSGEDKAPTEYAKTGVLTALTSPTGGRTEFKYENNTVLDKVDWITDASVPVIEGYYEKDLYSGPKKFTVDMPYNNGYITFHCTYYGNEQSVTDHKQDESAHPLISFSRLFTLWGLPADAKNERVPPAEQYSFEFRVPCKKGTYELTLRTQASARLVVRTSMGAGTCRATEKTVGGLRIAEIKSPVSTIKYSYRDYCNLPSGRLNRESIFSTFKLNVLYTYSKPSVPIGYYTILEYNSNSLVPLENPYNNYFMGYTHVTTTEEFQDEKIVETSEFYNQKEAEPRGFNDPGSIMPLNGCVLEHRIYSNGSALKQRTITQYTCDQLPDHLTAFKTNTGYPPFNYRIDRYHVAPSVVLDTLYATVNGRTICHPIKTEYDYDWRNYQILQKATTESGEKRAYHIGYILSYLVYKDVLEKYNYVSTPVVEDVSYPDKEGLYEAKKVIRTYYHNEMLSPWKEYVVYGEKIRKGDFYFNGWDDPFDEIPEVTYLTYDNSGRNTSLSTRIGQNIVFVWGYHHQYLIAQISNATAAEVQQAGVDFDAIGDKTVPSEADWAMLHSLRTKLPRSHVTVTQYEPLVGVVSQTDPRGITTRYTYDEFGRLDEVIENDNGKEYVLRKNEYKYANEK